MGDGVYFQQRESQCSTDRAEGKHRMLPRPFNPTLLTQDSRDYIVRFKPRSSISASGISRSVDFHEKTGRIDAKPVDEFLRIFLQQAFRPSTTDGGI